MEQTFRGIFQRNRPVLPSLTDNGLMLQQVNLVTAMIAISSAAALVVLGQLLQFNPWVLIAAVVPLLLLVNGMTHLLLVQKQAGWAAHVFAYGTMVAITVAAFFYGGAKGPLLMGYFVPVVLMGMLGRGSDTVRLCIFAILAFGSVVVAEEWFGFQPVIQVDIDKSYVFLVFLIVAISLCGYLAVTVGKNLNAVVRESNERAEELMLKTEQLMEKNIQQVELGSQLSSSATQMKLTAQQQASGAAEQASAVSEVGTTIEELGSTARQIAQSADHVAQAAHQTLENLSNGQDAVDESIQAMERIRGRVQDVSGRVLSLGERSQQIGEIIDLIDDISDETHLLALNAAIEAAGAGEHGRRFAVVAAEVKSLANRTLAAAKEVKGVIREIREATNSAVLAAEEGSKEVERGVDLAHRAGQVMNNIVMVAERTAQSAAEIGLATAQQQSASEQVVEMMREIADVARQSATGARQMADSATMLTTIASRLHGITQIEE
ncbi:MAG: methyl-accepting chemotaxis protein [Chloroflexaceae bacterium]|jgi:methyl-accepting chemotaxis protein|nr:methyl-accepting chemotaxis protein [Chloroflexaceae bacterium]